MFSRSVLASVPVLFLTAYVSAQDMTNAQLTAEVRSLKSQLTTLSENLTKGLKKIDDNNNVVNESQTQISQLRSEMLDLHRQINEQIRNQEEILNAISEKDAAGRNIPRLSAAMSSEKFRQDMAEAVNRSIQPRGTFEVTNKTNVHRRIQVNRTDYDLSPGETIKLTLDVGTVTTQLPGKEKETWTITAPSYWQGINIVPAPVPVLDSQYLNSPVYYYPQVGTPALSQINWPSSPIQYR